MNESESIQTLIFMDYETAGPWLEKTDGEEIRLIRDRMNEVNFSDHLAQLIANDCNPSRIPRIAEMSFISLPRCLFEEAAENMAYRLNIVEEATQKRVALKDESIKIDVAANLYTCQMNPELCEAEWDKYELKARSNRLRRSELQRKNTFAKEWPVVHNFLCNAPKPACLIAHNGLEYDFRILMHELRRCDLLNKYPIPDEVYFIDSLLSFVDIEQKHFNAIKLIFDNINWDNVAPQESGLPSMSMENIVRPNEGEILKRNDESFVVDDGDDIEFLGADCPLAENEPDEIEEITKAENNPQNCISTHQQDTTDKNEEEDEIEVIGMRLSQKRRKMSEGVCESLAMDNDHPFHFLRRKEWCPAKRRRITTRIFNKNADKQWYFSEQVAHICLQQAGRYKLEKMYKKIIGADFKAHRAQADSEALMQVSLAYGTDFLNFVDTKHAKFPSFC